MRARPPRRCGPRGGGPSTPSRSTATRARTPPPPSPRAAPRGAAGRSGAKVDQRRASVRIGGVDVFSRGMPSGAAANALRGVFERPSIDIEVHLGAGEATAKAWGCDLAAEYVRINAEYTT